MRDIQPCINCALHLEAAQGQSRQRINRTDDLEILLGDTGVMAV